VNTENVKLASQAITNSMESAVRMDVHIAPSIVALVLQQETLLVVVETRSYVLKDLTFAGLVDQLTVVQAINIMKTLVLNVLRIVKNVLI
jgi:hypothetical protein